MGYQRWDSLSESVVDFDVCDRCGCVSGVSGPCTHGCWPDYHTPNRPSEASVARPVEEQRSDVVSDDEQ